MSGQISVSSAFVQLLQHWKHRLKLRAIRAVKEPPQCDTVGCAETAIASDTDQSMYWCFTHQPEQDWLWSSRFVAPRDYEWKWSPFTESDQDE